jgi:hypothetical protein
VARPCYRNLSGGRAAGGAMLRKTLSKIDLRHGSNYNAGEMPSRLAATSTVAEKL